MGFLDRLARKSLPVNGGMTVETHVSAPAPLRNSPLDLIAANIGYPYICNCINARAVASTPYRVYTASRHGRTQKALGEWVSHKRVTGKRLDWVRQIKALSNSSDVVELTDHPMLDLLTTVSPVLDGFSLFELIEQYLGILGNAYVLVTKDGEGVPTRLDVLPAEYVAIRLDDSGTPVGYELWDGAAVKKVYQLDEVLHFKQTAVGGFRRTGSRQSVVGIYGMGTLEAVIHEAQLLESVNTYERSIMDNNGRPDYVVRYTNGKLDEKNAQKLLNKWNSMFRGMRRAGKVALLDQDFELKELGFSPRDLAYQEGKKWLRTAICNAYGVPESFVSTENSNRASSVVAIEQYQRFVVLPKLRRIQEVINQWLSPLYDDGIWLVFDDPVPENEDMQIRRDAADIASGIRTVDEIRAERGLPPLGELGGLGGHGGHGGQA